jgi:hypothetical protein
MAVRRGIAAYTETFAKEVLGGALSWYRNWVADRSVGRYRITTASMSLGGDRTRW